MSILERIITANHEIYVKALQQISQSSAKILVEAK
jgi:hypothetical protein